MCAARCSQQRDQQVPLSSIYHKKQGWSLRGWSIVALYDITYCCYSTVSGRWGGKGCDSIHLGKKMSFHAHRPSKKNNDFFFFLEREFRLLFDIYKQNLIFIFSKKQNIKFDDTLPFLDSAQGVIFLGCSFNCS